MQNKEVIDLFGMKLNDCSTQEVVGLVANASDMSSFEYVVTPNVDHLIRFYEDERFRELYANAKYVVNDSRILKLASKIFLRNDIKVAPGSDVTQEIFQSSILDGKKISIVGCEGAVIDKIRRKFCLANAQHVYPPFGFEKDEKQLEDVLRAVEEFKPNYTFICVGSPKQEIIAYELRKRGKITGVGLCVGASLLFLSGDEVRAPMWMQNLSLEWLFRLLQSPRRLAKRYLVTGPKVFLIFLGLKGLK